MDKYWFALNQFYVSSLNFHEFQKNGEEPFGEIDKD